MNVNSVYVRAYELKGEMEYKGQILLTYDIKYPQFSSERFRAFAKKLSVYYKAEATLYKKYHITKLYQMAIDDYEYATANNFPVRTYEVVTVYTITFNDNCVLSLYFDRYEYTGGAHGMTVRSADTWNLKTGRRIDLSEYFPGRKDYTAYILDAINSQIASNEKDNSNLYFEDVNELVKENFNEKNFYVVPEGIVIFFQLYEIAPYSSGIQSFLIPFKKGGPVPISC